MLDKIWKPVFVRNVRFKHPLTVHLLTLFMIIKLGCDFLEIALTRYCLTLLTALSHLQASITVIEQVETLPWLTVVYLLSTHAKGSAAQSCSKHMLSRVCNGHEDVLEEDTPCFGDASWGASRISLLNFSWSIVRKTCLC